MTKNNLSNIKNESTEDISYCYILECSDNTFYTGYTNRPEKRLDTHNSGKGAKYTRARLPVKFVFLRAFQSKAKAQSIEARIKSLPRYKKDLLVAGQLEYFFHIDKSNL